MRNDFSDRLRPIERARALVPLEAPTPAGGGLARPLAAFLAQLVACERRLDLYRTRRRAPPADAAARYRAADGLAPRPQPLRREA